jgi:3-demethoxyubiquinol 3-hydroxylase
MSRSLSFLDRLTAAADRALRTLAAPPPANRPAPVVSELHEELSPDERREAAALMRVNHVGEVCAQALYDAQALLLGLMLTWLIRQGEDKAVTSEA